MRDARPRPAGDAESTPSGGIDTWPPTSARRTWRVPAVTGPSSDPDGLPARLRPRLRDRDSWQVPVVAVPATDESTRARPAVRATLPELDDDPCDDDLYDHPCDDDDRLGCLDDGDDVDAGDVDLDGWDDFDGGELAARTEAVLREVREVDATWAGGDLLEPYDDPAADHDLGADEELDDDLGCLGDPGDAELSAGRALGDDRHHLGFDVPGWIVDDDRWPGDDTRQHRFAGLAGAMAREIVIPDLLFDEEGPADIVIEPPPLLDDHTDPRPAVARVRGWEREGGDRAAFLAAARGRMRASAPPPLLTGSAVPEPGFVNLSPDDLVGAFTRAVAEAGGTCHRVVGTIPESLLDRLVAELGTWEAVVSADADAAELAERFAIRGVEVADATPDAAAQASLGITSAVAGVAATGSLVLDSHRDRGRLVAVLPRVHVCVLPAERVVAAPADVLRGLGARPVGLPSSLVLVNGPARTGEIERLLTIGAHGPTALHVILVEPEPD
jgi:L-lactate dehydrogenase complex protein LldG